MKEQKRKVESEKAEKVLTRLLLFPLSALP
jgi:hypothetical protein